MTNEDGGAAQGPTGWDAAGYDRSFSFVARLGEDLIDLLDPQPGERVLDLGCGTGGLSAKIAARGAQVIGLDRDAAMVARAREACPTLTFVEADGADFRLAEPVDAVFSNAALHWMLKPDAVLACLKRALRPGGRLIAELGGAGNCDTVLAALHAALEDACLPAGRVRSPWYFPDPAEYRAKLEAHGFKVRVMHHFERPTPLDGGTGGLAAWLTMFAASFLEQVAPELRPGVIEGTVGRAAPLLYRDGQWRVDYWRLRVAAERRP
jgi:trans-aconitate methyltransferase